MLLILKPSLAICIFSTISILDCLEILSCLHTSKNCFNFFEKLSFFILSFASSRSFFILLFGLNSGIYDTDENGERQESLKLLETFDFSCSVYSLLLIGEYFVFSFSSNVTDLSVSIALVVNSAPIP